MGSVGSGSSADVRLMPSGMSKTDATPLQPQPTPLNKGADPPPPKVSYDGLHPDRREATPVVSLRSTTTDVRLRRWLLALFLALAAVATVQRGVLTHTHATYPIFRQSYVHLAAGQDLYARYPREQ